MKMWSAKMIRLIALALLLASGLILASRSGGEANPDPANLAVTTNSNLVETNSAVTRDLTADVEKNLKGTENSPQMKPFDVVGQWKSEYYGTRYLQIHEDGTATIYFFANAFARMFVGGKVKLDYVWHYDSDAHQICFTLQGGTPEKSAAYIEQTWGGEQRQHVISTSSEELHFRDLDEKTNHHWRRLEAIPDEVTQAFSK